MYPKDDGAKCPIHRGATAIYSQTNYCRTVAFILLISLCLIPLSGQSEELNKEQQRKVEQAKKRQTESEAKIYEAKRKPTVRITPDIITNLQTQANNKFMYIQLRMDLILFDGKDRLYVKMNQPLFRDPLILFLNNQSPLSFATPKRQATMEKRMIEVVNKAFAKEVDRPLVKDVIIQKINIE